MSGIWFVNGRKRRVGLPAIEAAPVDVEIGGEFDSTEVDDAVNALGGKVNEIITALAAAGIVRPESED